MFRMLDILGENLDKIQSVVIIISVITALIQYMVNIRKERNAKELGTYDSLDNKFIEFQLLCLEKSYLDIFDVPDKNPIILNESQKKEEMIAFSILLAMFERAYLMYKRTNFKGGKGQWLGWNEVMDCYAKRDNFRIAWETNGFGWDKDFEDLINAKIKNNNVKRG